MTTGPARTVVRLMVGNRVSAAYLALVVLVMAKATFDSVWAEDPDPDYAWLWPPLVTFPAFLLVSTLGRTAWGTHLPNWLFITTIAVSALLQALALGAVRQAIQARHRRATQAN
ncbi:SCO4225 family membrane protein [Streptomyces sp. NPDC059629]|uniref:SCO4225 family membrane protein n=1 Tax=Streptomyces sp. NPDC059629 TaxID=3346889 RepID=UPI003694ED67